MAGIAPGANTVADGYSHNDERIPVSGPDLDFTYNDGPSATPFALDSDNGDGYGTGNGQTGIDNHLPHPDRPMLTQTHEGEYRDDHGELPPVRVTRANKLFAFCAALNSCNLGYDIGVNTDAAMKLQNSMDLSDTQLEIFMGSLNLFAMIGALCAHAISDRFGRRGAFIVAAVGFIFGVLLQASAASFNVLMIGRVFVGLGVGFGLAVDPIYIAEISPAAHRGRLVTWSEIATNIGIVLGFTSGLAFLNVDENTAWRAMFAMGAILPTIMIFLAYKVMPESPRWLVSKGRESEALVVLEKIYPPGYNVNVIVEEIKEGIEREIAAEHAVGWDMILFPSPAFKRMLLVGIGTAVAQQVVGIDAIQYFLIFILDESGIKSRITQSTILIFLGLLKLAMIFVAGFLFDTKGRRPLMFTSLAGMTVALLLISVNFIGDSHNAAFAVVGIGLYLSFFSLGMGPGAWLIPSEVFSTSIRAKAMSVATFMNRVAGTLMTSTFLSVANALSWAGFFLLLAVVCLICLLFLYLLLPETKGRALEDMSTYFAEITGDRSILDVEETLARQTSNPGGSSPARERASLVSTPAEKIPQDAHIVGTLA
mmetsp:Transcript_25347/g.37181  ORF Transcript_25347/g.37181 Transcript_25347/m.37181 type:complete len:595 (+) Transcript_25347:83-1867(+)